MLSALLHGKLSRSQENMEDILTSIVFDSLRYLPPENGILPFLANATTPDGLKPFAGRALVGVSVEYKFWPGYSQPHCNGCEPDVELLITWPTGETTLLFIEAKYHSGKSSKESDDIVDGEAQQPAPPIDQLAREWQNLVSLATERNTEPLLVYLTGHVGCPQADIRGSQQVFKRKCPKALRKFNCVWLSWRHLHALTGDSSSESMKELKQLLERLNLQFFSGIRFQPVTEFSWNFAPAGPRRQGHVRTTRTCKVIPYDFSCSPLTLPQWRFKT
jgi:hypothetical protein